VSVVLVLLLVLLLQVLVVLVMLLQVLVVLVLLLLLWEMVPLEGTSSREDAPKGAVQMMTRRKWPGRLAVTRTMVPGRNDQSRQSWRMIGVPWKQW
jgi:hypothetical protein